MSGIRLHDFNCGLKIYRREVTQAIEVYGEFHRYLPALAHWAGFRVGEMAVRHRARRYGKSKFGAARFVNGFLDLMGAAFIHAKERGPLHFFGRLGWLRPGPGSWSASCSSSSGSTAVRFASAR